MWRRVVPRLLVGAVVVPMTAWAALAVYYGSLPRSGIGTALALAFAMVTAVAFAVLPRPRRTLAGFVVVFALIVIWWRAIPASNDRPWQPDVAVVPWATVEGDRVTIHGVRNFGYRTETDVTPRWEDRTYDLRQLDSVDLIAVYWGSRAIAHIMVSFGFRSGDQLAMSIETRKEPGETYSAVAGFFKQYELVYVVADERDVIRVRTTYRHPLEDVYVYRVRAPRDNIRRVFLDYLREMNDLRDHPRFYNTLTTNCTTGAILHTRVNPQSPAWSWKLVLSGYLPEYAHELGRLDATRPFPELERLSRVNDRARAADADPDFSRRIRDGLPAPTPLP